MRVAGGSVAILYLMHRIGCKRVNKSNRSVIVTRQTPLPTRARVYETS